MNIGPQRYGRTHEVGIGATNRMGYYAMRGRVARNCWTCDRKRCKCDVVQMRKIKRGAKHRWRQQMALEANEPRPQIAPTPADG